jgi:hypothetical protein
MPRNRNRSALKTAVVQVADSITPTALDRKHVEVLANLHEGIEGLRSEDGTRCLVQAVEVDIQMRAVSYIPYKIFPVLIQTAGTPADLIDQATGYLSVALDVATDDVFGFECIPNRKGFLSRPIPGGDDVVSGITAQFVLPIHAIQILNKEVETERLQNLWLGLVQVGGAPVEHILNAFLTYTYTETRKGLLLR